MTSRKPPPRMHLISDQNEVRRINTALLCTDADGIPKVSGAGQLFIQDGAKVQRMHNGILIEEGCYYGQWMTEIIRSLHGHHEPQEEFVFDQVIARLFVDDQPKSMLEFGSFWTYYGMWFAQQSDRARVIALEPDPHNLEAGRRNAVLNGLNGQITFVAGAVGNNPGTAIEFTAESDGLPYALVEYDLQSLMAAHDIEHVDLVLVDIQGAEQILLPRALDDFARGRVRFLMVSTHHNSISGSALTHQNCLALLKAAGAHVIAEHSVSESFSGDGLIAVSFDPQDRGLSLEVSVCRSKDSLFYDVEYELDHAMRERDAADQRVSSLVAEINAMKNTKRWRWSSPLARLRSRRP